MVGLFTHVETILAFMVFMLPGFLSLRAYEAARGGEGRKMSESLVDVAIYSSPPSKGRTDSSSTRVIYLRSNSRTGARWYDR
ncbi:MAG: hypothetical protein QOI11_2340 [Candidatus Eremiobacteraeota bacterium]|nr:hypothetical protein [Candidatus Eremiobacteraeota bacterium]